MKWGRGGGMGNIGHSGTKKTGVQNFDRRWSYESSLHMCKHDRRYFFVRDNSPQADDTISITYVLHTVNSAPESYLINVKKNLSGINLAQRKDV